ncbi:MAG TPA: C39 family peptidase [Planctomycetota bacterium]|nr:C39 family peptidase [Planctomycetota bacterium]
MRRAWLLVLAAALVARADDSKETRVTTFVAEDTASLASGTLGALPTLESRPIQAVAPFDRVCVSVNATVPGDARVEVAAKVGLESGATEWLALGTVANPDDGAKVPCSVSSKDGSGVKVAIDTIELEQAKGRTVTVRLVLHRSSRNELPHVRRIAVAAWPHGKLDAEPASRHPAWGKVLEVVERSQRVEDPKISGRICSATSLGMVLVFHGFKKETAEVCREVLDHEAGIYGNWALNVAYAGRLGLDAAIVRMGSFAPLEAEIAAGRPVVISHRWSKGELSGAPISSTDGHLIVVRGFTKEGDLVVNDPAADPRKGEKIQRVYKRAEIARTWLGNTDGIAYVLEGKK